MNKNLRTWKVYHLPSAKSVCLAWFDPPDSGYDETTVLWPWPPSPALRIDAKMWSAWHFLYLIGHFSVRRNQWPSLPGCPLLHALQSPCSLLSDFPWVYWKLLTVYTVLGSHWKVLHHPQNCFWCPQQSKNLFFSSWIPIDVKYETNSLILCKTSTAMSTNTIWVNFHNSK